MSNLSEEEKKIVAYLRFYLNDTENEYFDKDFIISKKDLTVILNLIERQQKELDKKDKIISEIKNINEKTKWKIKRIKYYGFQIKSKNVKK